MSDAPRPWDRLQSDVVQDCRVFQVRQVAARSPCAGDTHTFFTLDAPDWVNVVPVTPDGEVVLVRQFRHGAGAVTLEIPGGMVDPGESPAEAAARELLEETGYEPEALATLGVVNPNPALFGNHCTTYLARDVRQVAPIRNEGAEETRVVRVPEAEIPALLREGAIDHALVVAAFHWYALHRER